MSVDDNQSLRLKPASPSFGFVCVGGIYRLRIVLINYGDEKERIKIQFSELEGNPLKLSYSLSQAVILKGVPVNLDLDTSADIVGSFEFQVSILQSSGKKTCIKIDVVVLPYEAFDEWRVAIKN